MTDLILAIDLGKFKCVACAYRRDTAAAEFRAVTTSRAEVERLIRATAPAVVVIEACSLTGWVHDLCGELGVRCRVANTAAEAWKYKHARRKTDRDDALRLAQLEALGQLPGPTPGRPRNRIHAIARDRRVLGRGVIVTPGHCDRLSAAARRGYVDRKRHALVTTGATMNKLGWTLGAAVILLPSAPVRAADTSGVAFFRLAAPGGFVVLSDAATLVVSQPKAAALVYYDTVAGRETRRVAVDFKPTALALRGDTLFAASEGSARVYALDTATGKVRREYNAGGDAVAGIACHPANGPLYVVTESRKVYAIDPATGSAVETAATGDFVAVDPVGGEFVFTGIRPPPDQQDLIIQTEGGNRLKVIWDRWGSRGMILKYAVKGQTLKYVAAQRNAAVNPYTLYLTPDGGRVMMTGGGGWRPPPEAGAGGGGTAVFGAGDLGAMIGQAPGASNVAFHPVLDLGVANQGGRDLVLFAAGSLVERGKLHVAKGADERPLLLAFVGKGCKVAVWNGDNPANPEEGLHLIPLDLKPEERARLAKVYGQLPPPPATMAQAGAAGGVIAEIGFNDARGIHADGTADSPYPLGKANRAGGRGEPGWDGHHEPSPNIEYQADVVSEGDGAARLRGTVALNRRLKDPQAKVFRVEQQVRVPAAGGVTAYVQAADGVAENSGPMWKVEGGKFSVRDGDEFGGGTWIDAGVPCQPDTWYKVAVVVDVPRRTWEFFVDGRKFQHRGLRFRGRPESLQRVSYLSETQPGVYLDAVRVTGGGLSPGDAKPGSASGTSRPPGPDTGSATRPAVETKEDLRKFLSGTEWAWAKGGLRLDPDGSAVQPEWAAAGLVTRWEAIDRRTAVLVIVRGREHDRHAVLQFAEDLGSFTGYDFEGGRRLEPTGRKP